MTSRQANGTEADPWSSDDAEAHAEQSRRRRNGEGHHEEYEALDSGSDDEYQMAGTMPPPELPELGNMQLDPDRERMRAWAAAQIPDPAGRPERNAQATKTPAPESDIQIDQERKAAILGAMKNIQLDYIPPWALRISENEFEKEVKAVVRSKAPQD